MADEKKESSADSLGSIFSGEAASKEPSPTSEKSPDASSKDFADSKKDESSPSKDGAEKLPGEKEEKSKESDTPPSEIKAGEQPGDKKDSKELTPEEKAAAEKVEADKKKVADPEAVASVKKQLDDTRKWGNALSQENSQLKSVLQEQQAVLEILQKKVDGTWTEQDEADLNKGNTTEDVAARSLVVGKAVASRAAAISQLGPEVVNTGLSEFHKLFNNNSMIQAVIREAESPVHEALAIMDRYKFEQEHGITPKQWVESITKKVIAEHTAKLRKDILEEIRLGKKKAADTPESLSSVSGESRGENDRLKEEAAPSLKSLFS